MKLKQWIPAIVLSIVAAGLLGGVIFVATLPPERDRSAALSAQVETLDEQKQALEAQIAEKEAALEQLQEQVARQESMKARLDEDPEKYADLAARWDALPAVLDTAKETAGVGNMMSLAVPPNYDRPALTHLQRGNKVASNIWGSLGGIFGSAVGNQVNNLTQEDVGALHTAVNTLTNEINAAARQAERSLAAYQAASLLIDQVYDPAMTGAGLEGQIQFLERMYRDRETGEEKVAMLHDAAYAVVTMRCGEEIYAAFLSDGAERNGYLNRLAENRQVLERALANHGGMAAESYLSQDELGEIYRWTIRRQQELGLLVQSSEIWKDTSTMQTPLLATGSQAGMAVGSQKMLMTYRTDNKRMMYATDPKGDVTAFYGFSRDGEPMCFARGDRLVLFDWRTKDGCVLFSTSTDSENQRLYTFSAFIRDHHNGITPRQYKDNQTVY